MPRSAAPLLLLALSQLRDAAACTNMLVSAGATTDGSTHIAYNADDGGLYGSLGHYPAADHPPGSPPTKHRSRMHTLDESVGAQSVMTERLTIADARRRRRWR